MPMKIMFEVLFRQSLQGKNPKSFIKNKRLDHNGVDTLKMEAKYTVTVLLKTAC